MPEALHTVLVPGLLCSPALYEPVLDAVWVRGSVAVADTRRDDTIAAIAERLLAAAPPRFALAGLSMGGYVALEVVRQAPERVRALGLLSTSARADVPEQSAARREQVALARSGRFDELVEPAFRAIVAPARVEDAALREAFGAMARRVGTEAFATQQAANAARRDAREALGAIACPTTVLHGLDDQLIDPDRGRELAAGIPGAELVLLEGCGHSPTWEAPAATAAALDALLARAA